VSFDLGRARREVSEQGFSVVENVLDDGLLQATRAGLYRARDGILRDIGNERLELAGERGTLRLLFEYDPVFFQLLEVPELLAWIDEALGPTAILHTQNGFILPTDPDASPDIFQHRFHKDFPRYLNGYVASTNVMFTIDDYNASTGATLAVAGSHQREIDVDPGEARRSAIPIDAPRGSMIIFDSTLWHAAGINRSGADRLAVNQFTRSWIKQQIDYVRAIGEETILGLKPRTQQLLGWHTRVVTSLEEYYVPEEERRYRRGQGKTVRVRKARARSSAAGASLRQRSPTSRPQ